jgi:hypothetical protein
VPTNKDRWRRDHWRARKNLSLLSQIYSLFFGINSLLRFLGNLLATSWNNEQIWGDFRESGRKLKILFFSLLAGNGAAETGSPGLRPPPATPSFWRALGRRWKSSTYPGVTVGDSAHRRSLASFFVVTCSFGVSVSGGQINFRGGRKAGKERTNSRLEETARKRAANARLGGSPSGRSQRARDARGHAD